MDGTVLVVDDDRNLSQILAKALGGEGYRVVTALDGDEALTVFAEASPDLVLLDLILPRRDGFAVLEAIRAQHGPAGSTRVVIMSGCTPTPEYRKRAASLDASELLTKPVPLDQLLSVVAAAIGESKPEAAIAGETESEAGERPHAPLRGSLKRLPFPALLHHLHGLRASGVLHLESGKKQKWLELRDGHCVAVRSNLVNECLGHHLLRTGRIGQAELDESIRRMKSGGLQGEILVAMQVMSEEDIVKALQVQADEKLFEVFAWEDGTFRFEKGIGLERANTVGVRRSPANLILHGIRTQFSGDRVQEFFHSHADCTVVPGDSPYYRFQEIELEPSQEALMRELDGTRRVSEILDGDFNLRLGRTLYALVATGLLTLRGGSVRGAPPDEMPDEIPDEMPDELREAGRRATPARNPDCTSEADFAALRAMVDRFRTQNYFEILGIEPRASQAEVEQAFANLAEQAHPDRHSDSSYAVRRVAEEMFAQLTRAYATLSDARLRGEYVRDQRREERVAEKEAVGQRALEAANQFQRGETLMRARAYEEAMVCFGSALELNPDEGDYRAHYGWALHLTHPSDPEMLMEAIEHVRGSLKLASHADRSYLYMGRLLRAMGRPAGAEKMFTRAVEIEPDSVEALRELRLINMRRERSKGLIKRLLRR